MISLLQETRWLEYMRSQLSTTHGDIGVSVASVDKLTAEHDKFIETAKVCEGGGEGERALVGGRGRGERALVGGGALAGG